MISMIYYHYFEIIVPESLKQPYRRELSWRMGICKDNGTFYI